MSSKVLLLIVSTVLLFTNILTYTMLLSKNTEWKNALSEKQLYGNDVSFVAETLAEHLYYDGDTIQSNQMVKQYNSSGELIQNISLDELLEGDKIVILLSVNNCTPCTIDEINKMLELGEKIGKKNLVFVADYAIHSCSELSKCFNKAYYYETDVEHLGLNGSPTRETPVVMLVQDGRVKTSFPVGQETIGFIDSFHNYLMDYFREKI